MNMTGDDGSLEYLRFKPLSRHPTFKQDEYLASYHAAGTPHAPRKEPAGPHQAPSPSLPALLWQQDSRLGAARGLRVCRYTRQHKAACDGQVHCGSSA